MDGWIDGWIDGRMDGWMDGWMDTNVSKEVAAQIFRVVRGSRFFRNLATYLLNYKASQFMRPLA